MNAMGHDVQPDAVIHPRCFFGARTGVTMGRAVNMNYGCVIDLGAPVTFDDHAMIGMEVMIITVSHELGPTELRCGEVYVKPVHIGEGAWVGARVTILPGVTIGAGCVIATGSVVTTDCESDHLYGGVPARKIRALSSEAGG
jgi:acetyltransferase-like isoleucine patch superfamily enzyme